MPMLDDMAYKLARKLLSAEHYRAFSRSVLGRSRAYDVLSTYESIYRHYLEKGLAFSGKTVLEVGAGRQFFTSFFFLAAGADTVLLAEPVFSWEKFDADLDEFNGHSSVQLDSRTARAKIHGFPSMQDIPESWNARVDLGCSHNVLEHFADLPGYFRHTARLLSPSSIAYNKVDLSDHTYHIFGKYGLTKWIQRRRMLYHLRYSNPVFDKLNDPKCYMNRILLPTYLEIVKAHGLKVRELTLERQGRTPIHEDLLSHANGARPEELFISGFAMTVSL